MPQWRHIRGTSGRKSHAAGQADLTKIKESECHLHHICALADRRMKLTVWCCGESLEDDPRGANLAAFACASSLPKGGENMRCRYKWRDSVVQFTSSAPVSLYSARYGRAVCNGRSGGGVPVRLHSNRGGNM